MTTPAATRAATRNVEPVLVIRPAATMDSPVLLAGNGVNSGINHFPSWLYDEHTRFTPRQVRSAVLYTSTGAHDLADVLTQMTSGPEAEKIRSVVDELAAGRSPRGDVEGARDNAFEHMQLVWTEFLDGIDL